MASASTVRITSSYDASRQLASWYDPGTGGARPLLVYFHTWGGSYVGLPQAVVDWCQTKGVAVICPNARGRNAYPWACMSRAAIADALDAITYAKAQRSIDDAKIALQGESGGASMAIAVASRAGRAFAGVSAWCGIYDVTTWHAWCVANGATNYTSDMSGVTGGAPGDSNAIDLEYRERSPLTYVAQNTSPLDIVTGVSDVSVGTRQSLRLWNAACATADQVSGSDITTIEGGSIPVGLQFGGSDTDFSGVSKNVLMRKTSGNHRVTVFNGGHETINGAAQTYLNGKLGV